MGQDLYAILDIQRGASTDEIRRAYKKLALQYHPDKNKSADAETRFKQISQAYEVLNDPEKRRIYDRYGEEGLSSSTRSRHKPYNSDFNPFNTFRMFFGGNDPFADMFTFHPGIQSAFVFTRSSSTTDGRGRTGNTTRKANDVEHTVYLTLDEILFGCNKKMKVHRKRTIRSGSVVGNITSSARDPMKTIQEERLLTFDVPAGAKSGTKIRFIEEGNQIPGQIPADVVFIIKDQPHPLFKRDEIHLHTLACIGLRFALLGGELQVAGLKGDIHTVKVNTIQNSLSTIRIPNAGLPKTQKTPGIPPLTERGDIIVHFQIKLPTEDLLTKHIRTIRETFPDCPFLQGAPPNILHEPRTHEPRSPSTN